MDEKEAVVIDNGSCLVKAGFAGDDCHRVVFPAIVGTPRHNPAVVGSQYKDTYVGDEATIARDILTLTSPREYPDDPNWEDMEKIWHHTFYNELRVDPKDHDVLLTESPSTPKRHREKMTEIFFETFNVPAFTLEVDAVLSLYSAGIITGCVLSSGYNVTYCVPVYEGFALSKDTTRLDLAGNGITECLCKMLQTRGYDFYSSRQKLEVNEMKKLMAYTALDYDSELEACRQSSDIEKSYQLPDGTSVSIRDERFRCVEAMFKPTMADICDSRGVHDLLNDTLSNTHEDIRKDMFGNVVLSGANTMFHGFPDRIKKELDRLAPEGTNVKVTAPPERKSTTWIGGSILASLSTYKGERITKQEYEESGSAIVHTKCF